MDFDISRVFEITHVRDTDIHLYCQLEEYESLPVNVTCKKVTCIHVLQKL